jgi:hypothetical protein
MECRIYKLLLRYTPSGYGITSEIKHRAARGVVVRVRARGIKRHHEARFHPRSCSKPRPLKAWASEGLKIGLLPAVLLAGMASLETKRPAGCTSGLALKSRRHLCEGICAWHIGPALRRTSHPTTRRRLPTPSIQALWKPPQVPPPPRTCTPQPPSLRPSANPPMPRVADCRPRRQESGEVHVQSPCTDQSTKW